MNIESSESSPEKPRTEATIGNAGEEDINEILTIQAQKLVDPENIAQGDTQEIEEKGFLVYPLSKSELEELIKDPGNHIIKVAKKDGRVIGYLIAYDLDNWRELHPDWLNNLEGKRDSLTQRRTLFGRHIAVDESETGSGIGRALLEAVIFTGRTRDYQNFVVEVLDKPITNRKSTKFVERAGFKKIGQRQDGGLKVWSIYSLKI